MNTIIQNRIESLKSEMSDHRIDAVIIPQTDPHQSEYLADHWQVREYFSGFSGSAGTLVVTSDQALLWTDSRYFIQAAHQLKDTPIQLMKDGLHCTPSIEDWLLSNLKAGSRVGIDGMLLSKSSADAMRKALAANGIDLVCDFDPIDKLWPERPSLPSDMVFVHEEKYAGESADIKIRAILKDAHNQGATSVLISPLDEIAWALNIRCSDVRYNPVATAYLFVSAAGSTLFINPDKISASISNYLKDQGVDVLPYHDIKAFLANLPQSETVLVEGGRTSVALSDILGGRTIFGQSPIAIPKGCKNAVQIAGIRDAMIRDGVALVKAFKDIDDMVSRGETLTEIGVSDLLLKYRKEQPLFFDESFGTIAGFGPHGAIVHYEATPETDVEIKPSGLLLVDSGAQYLDGTTDITRTISIGTPSEKEKHDFTLVMKGHINLACMVFPEGTHGVQLDAEARKFLWKEGMGYLHGTGHGVGHFLNVHEGPQSIRLNYTPVPMMPGMVTSNEPGLYKEDIYGIRCENLMLCTEAMANDFGRFFKFETLTLFPFDISLLQTEIMTPEEIDWLNEYHEAVYSSLAPHLSDDEKAWLKSKTTPIKK